MTLRAGDAIAPPDLAHCRAAIRSGSLSFHTASRLLPGRVRDPALALYAFCRLADDAVDEVTGGAREKARAVLSLDRRLDLVYAGRPRNAPEDRAFAAVVAASEMPRALPDALIEGLAWDAAARRYDTLSDVRAYSARVASAVGAMMCVLMGVRCEHALARACDLGVAMQLTNIARDVGEDARAGRLYLPTEWLDAAGMTPDGFLRDLHATPEVRAMTARLLAEARRLYLRGASGVPALPAAARTGIYAARHIYAGIGGAARARGFDTVTVRARTGRWQKLGWVALSAGQAAVSMVMPAPATIYAPPLPEVAFLVHAARRPSPALAGRLASVVAALAELDARREMTGLRGA